MHEEFMNSLYFLLCLCACFLSWSFFLVVVVEHGCLYACMHALYLSFPFVFLCMLSFLGGFVVQHGFMHALSLSFPFGFLYMLSFLVVLLLNMVACKVSF